jgi:hypothetical protein
VVETIRSGLITVNLLTRRAAVFAAAFRSSYLHDVVRGMPVLQQPGAFGLKRSGGANANALAAEDAGSRAWMIIKRGDGGVKPTSRKVNRMGVLGILCAYLHAAPAQYAFVVIAYKHGVVIQHRLFTDAALETFCINTVLL